MNPDQEQSDLGPYGFQDRLPKNISRQESRPQKLCWRERVKTSETV